MRIAIDGRRRRLWLLCVGVIALSGCARAGFAPLDGEGRADGPPTTADTGVHDSDNATSDITLADGRVDGAGALRFSCDIADPELAACYSFEGEVRDGSANANHPSELVDVAYAPGIEGEALLHGATSRVVVPDHASFNGGGARTIEMWFRLDEAPAAGARMGLIDKHYGFGIFVHSDLLLQCSQGDPGAFTTVAVSVGRWTHIACVSDGVDLTLYRDGHLEAAASTVPLTTATAPLFIGANSPTGSDPLVGRIDNLRIWRRERSAAEICVAADCL